ncbi:class I SAM-dependent methyltransferase [Treponema parvum]|uniref:Class I SAM-dependent methyltransferase n=2 Tax=Treponema parvum TaxID=138851 RepID=A0A975IE52_9SPIR|nr:class I SAM-dependent methyltransferase [Treponema parvum]
MQKEYETQVLNDRDAMQKTAERRYLNMFLYERPYEKSYHEEKSWLTAMAKAASKILQIDLTHIIIKMRRHSKGGSQYANYADSVLSEVFSGENVQNMTAAICAPGADSKINLINTKEAPDIFTVSNKRASAAGIVQEHGLLFTVDLLKHLDSGLFLDHRPLRRIIRETSKEKSVLNLFCYTGSFSVYAAAGEARMVESVDLSNAYLSLAKKNMKLNGFRSDDKYVFTRSDVIKFLEQKAALMHSPGSQGFDIIILDPPTFSNSKSSQSVLDINRDWPYMVNMCVSLLNRGGVLYFSTNSRRLVFDISKIYCSSVERNFKEKGNIGCSLRAGSPSARGLLTHSPSAKSPIAGEPHNRDSRDSLLSRGLLARDTIARDSRAIEVEDISLKTVPEDFRNVKIHRCWKITV